ncbi:MAG TPA: protein-methionine-sulfoxide reductase catalytic subunit MsrP [Steroidobacteraceae bacterium]|nr:protein-methionine-sulfoxide reductase catalytic subunit MsrP [Steroidobacteraceae bacterium]
MLTRVPRIAPSEITPPEVYFSRRALLTGALAVGVSSLTRPAEAAEGPPTDAAPLAYTANPRYSVSEAPNKYAEITTYNNYYEFGTDKQDPSENARSFRTRPWNVTIDGEAEVRGSFTLEDILKGQSLEERIYRFRCVEAWSLVVPWVGFPLSSLLARFKPTSRAKYVEFTTLYDPRQMPGQRFSVLDWPYVEGLRMDEAMHPLTLMVVGLYGRVLPNQDGAPLRLIVPWKYGFKSIKSIVRIRFSESQPRTAWNVAAPHEYGFYANVNPEVDHPRWSQATERRIGAPFLAARRPTLLFNGYAAEVASLYQGMDLRRYF